MSELLAERGLEIDANCIWRWVRADGPIDETYVKVKAQDKYLYRALDSTSQTIDFLLAAKRDKAAARRFLVRAIEA